MDLIFDTAVNVTMAVVALCFIAGVATTALTGEARPVKVLLACISGVLFIALVVGVVLTRGLLIYLLFQVVIVIILLDFVVIAGAVCGGGIYVLLHRKPVGQGINPDNVADYVSVKEFAALEGVDEDRLVARIKSGFSTGGRYQGAWYIHRSERSPESALQVGVVPLPGSSEVRKGKLGS